METENIISLKHDLMSDLMEECQAQSDLTIICRDGKLRCNSLLLFATFRGMDEIIQDKDTTILIIPDVETQCLQDFLESLYNQNEVIVPHPSIEFLLYRYRENRCLKINDEKNTLGKLDQEHCDNGEFESLDADVNSEDLRNGKPRSDEKTVTISFSKNGRNENEDMRSKIRRSYVRKHQIIHHILRFPYKELYCQVCDLTIGGSSKVMINESKLFSHVYYNHGPFPERKCPDCDVYLYSPKSLDKHRRHEHKEKLPCPECGKLILPNVMRSHVMNYHEKLQCEQCPRKFSNKTHLSNHILAVHENVRVPRQSWRMEERCDKECKCGIDFPTLKAKLSHFKLVHLNYIICPSCNELIKHENDPHVCNPDRHKEYRRKNSLKEKVCKECGKVFANVHRLIYHRENVHKTEECSCELCGKVFINKFKLAAHLSHVNHSGKTTCSICGVQVLNIKRHMKNAHRG